MAELFCVQIETTMGHCNVFQWLNEILTPLRLTPITCSQRSDWILFQISATCTIGAIEAKLYKKPSKTQFKSTGRDDGEGSGREASGGFISPVFFGRAQNSPVSSMATW